MSTKKILIGCNHLNKFGGSETYTFTLAQELSKQGFEVDVFTRQTGTVSDKISGFAKIINLKQLVKNEYSLALISHNTIFVADIKAKTKVHICHGIFPFMEQASFRSDVVVCISKEVQDHSKLKGFDCKLIHNLIDTERFKSTRPISRKLTSILSLCQGEEANEILSDICKELNINFTAFNKFDKAVWEIENEINKADLVVSLGRGAMESMACGRSVLVFDSRKYTGNYSDGLLLQNNFKDLLEHNFSGRKFKYKGTKEFIKNQLLKYNSEQGAINRQLAVKNFSAKNIAKQLLNLQNEVKKETLLTDQQYKSLDKKFVCSKKNSQLYFVSAYTKVHLEKFGAFDILIRRRKKNDVKIKVADENILKLIPTVSIQLQKKLDFYSRQIKEISS